MDSPARLALGAALLRYRLARGLSLRQLASRLGMQGHGGLSEYEKGRRIPPADLIERYELHLRITDGELRALRTAALAERAASAVREVVEAAEPIAELPAVPPDFQGREQELARVLGAAADCLSGTGPVTLVIAGQPGAGKTTLAVRAASQAYALGLRDAQFFVELGQASPVVVLHRLLRALGVPDGQLPPDESGAAGLFRSRLAGRKCVLVLDNARDEAQVRPLLPGPGPVLVVLTSRRQLTGLAGARRVDLAELTESDAARLLAEIAGSDRVAADPMAAAEVIGACGRLPLAVRIAGNRLACRPQWDIAYLAELLRDEQSRLGRLTAGDLGVRSAFALSYRELPESSARLFRRLSVIPAAEFGVEAATALLGESAEEVLEILAGASLLAPAAVPGRYRLHDLLRLYGAELLADDERHEVQVALYSWLFGHARCAVATLAPGGAEYPGGRAAALSWLDAEAEALLRAARTAAEREDGQLDRYLGDLTQWIPWYYDLRCRWQDMVDVARCALAIAERAGDVAARAYAYSMLGLGELGLHRYRLALDSFDQGLADARTSGLAAEEAELYGRLGLAYEGLGQYAEAGDRHAEHANLCRELGDQWGEAAAVGRRSQALRMLGDHAAAADCLRTALKMRSQLGDERGVAMAEYRFSALRNDQRRWEEALIRGDRALKVFQAHDDRWGTAVAHFELGRALAGLGRFKEAATSYRVAVGAFDELGEWQRHAEAVAALTDAQSRP